ncbi:hypothetical protein [Bacillus sp. MB2021]|uniref:hypothetical protein n=1 Tax=Bacillus sp. MB2021 TaxID=1408303 RepID=UPI0004E28534|nr:hypothetical protein [Bacillus sp. MB2021]
MTIEQIKTTIDQLERTLFLHLLQPLAIEELEQLQGKTKVLREAFLETCFVGYSVEELEEIRFKLVEISYSLIITLKEQLHQNVTEDIRKLESLRGGRR